MNARVSLRSASVGLVLSLVIPTFASGCNFFGPRSTPQTPPTRPAPTRMTGRRAGVTGVTPSPTPGMGNPLRPAPTKRLPAIRATDISSLRAAVDRCKAAVEKNDWAKATREANSLGATWTRFKPAKSGTMSATEMKTFDVNYAKLQKDVRARNKSGCLRDTRALMDTVNKMRT
ncbi:MAG: DUF4363 family protein [Bacteroidota bacterium]